MVKEVKMTDPISMVIRCAVQHYQRIWPRPEI